MIKETILNDGRVDRKWFPDVESVDVVMGEHTEAREQRLSELYKLSQAALNELKGLHGDVKEGLGTLIGNVKNDIVDLFDEELTSKNLRGSAAHLSRSVGDFIKGSAEELIKIKDGGDDLAFLLKRMVQYRNALLGSVQLRDPVGGQDEMVGRASLVYPDPGGQAYSCEVRAHAPLGDLVKDRAGVQVREAKVPTQDRLDALVRAVYEGAPGIVDRMNVLFVTAPEGAGLEPKVVLNKAASLYRKTCRKVKDIRATRGADADRQDKGVEG